MKTGMAILLSLVVLSWGSYVSAAEQPPPVPAEEKPQVLTSGPMNEAFAAPVALENREGIVAPKEPPPNIKEVPAAEKPAGDQYVWIPGYWGWDPARNDYVWVSGCWRAAPPGTYWVPGYWSPVAGGWQWVAGFWSPVASGEIEYLPAPPPLTEVEPPGPAPPDNVWVPPCWYWYENHYVWRAGYWLPAQPDWVWVPSHYVWTPRGYVFVPGHWDYVFGRRGILYAPVYFPSPVYLRPGFSFSLGIIIATGNLEVLLFAYPRYCHYYFGDYYDHFFVSIGIFPWFDCVTYYTWYDPIYIHDRWRNLRLEPGWEARVRQEYGKRRQDPDLRPPRTYNALEERLARASEPQRQNMQFARPINAAAKNGMEMEFEKTKKGERQEIAKQSTEVHEFSQQRRQWELQGQRPREDQPEREQAPAAERRETAPGVEPRRPESREAVPAAPERRGQTTPPVERPTPEVRPSEPRRGMMPAPPAIERQAPTAPPSQQRPPSVSPPGGGLNQSERVRVPTPSAPRPGGGNTL